MKKILVSISMVLALASMAMAETLVKTSPGSFNGNLSNETGLAYSTTYTLDLALYDANRVSAVVNYSSTTFASKTFTDGQQSTGTITVLSTVSLSGVTLTIGGVTVTFGTSFPVVNSTTDTATNLAQAINASTCPLSSMIDVEAIGRIVYATSTLVGGNFAMSTSNSNKVQLSSANMYGGQGAYYSAASNSIQIASHGFPLALPVLYTQGALIGGLTDQTTYYALPIDSSHLSLSSSSALAIAGTAVDITTQRAQAAKNTYTLAPLAMDAANASAKWQLSNDGSNFSDIGSISTVFVSSATGSTFTAWDFSEYNYRYLRLAVTGPATGGIVMKAVMNAKK